MSADNFYVVAQRPDNGRWYAFMGFASDDGDFEPNLHEDWSFETELDALHWAMSEYSEYGVQSGEWPAYVWVSDACPNCHGTGEATALPGEDCRFCEGDGDARMSLSELQRYEAAGVA